MPGLQPGQSYKDSDAVISPDVIVHRRQKHGIWSGIGPAWRNFALPIGGMAFLVDNGNRSPVIQSVLMSRDLPGMGHDGIPSAFSQCRLLFLIPSSHFEHHVWTLETRLCLH